MRVEMKAEQTVEDAVGLRPGERLERLSNRTTGFMGCDDITEYAILDGKGNPNGTAVLTGLPHLSRSFCRRIQPSLQVARRDEMLPSLFIVCTFHRFGVKELYTCCCGGHTTVPRAANAARPFPVSCRRFSTVVHEEAGI